MSELGSGAVSLEDDPTPTAEPQAPAAQVEAQTPPANPEDADPEGTVVDQGGQKLIPLSALAAARQAARDAKAEAAALKGKAEKLDQIAGEWQAAQPYIERAKQMVANQPPPKQAAGPLTDQDAIEYAKDLDLFTPDGQPDVARAQRLAARQEAIARGQAQQFVTPLVQHNAQTQSRTFLEQAAAFKDQKGNQVDRATLEKVWASVPPELSAQPNVAGVLWRVALAEQVLAGNYRGASPPPPPVTHSDALGGGGHAPASLTSMDHAFRSAADMSEKDFTATRERYQPGRVNSLE